MTRLIVTISLIAFLSCKTNGDRKEETSIDKTTDKKAIEKLPKFYAGDTALSLGFQINIDTAFAYSKQPDYTNFEKTSVIKSKDTIIINAREILVSSCYNGACEKHGDTIVMNYWIDTLDCIAAESPFILTYKIKKTKYSYLKLTHVDNKRAPRYKDCED